MRKREFLATLRERLTGEISSAAVEEHIRYYSQYIDQEVAAGKTEEEVLTMLGDPNMLARTIIDAAGGQGSYTEPESGYSDTKQSSKAKMHTMNLQPWIIIAILVVLVFALGALFVRLLPILIVGAAIVYMMKRLRR